MGLTGDQEWVELTGFESGWGSWDSGVGRGREGVGGARDSGVGEAHRGFGSGWGSRDLIEFRGWG